MKKSLFFLFSIFLTLQLIAQNNPALEDDCPPVPWVYAEILEDKTAEATWEKPCDTCNNSIYRVIAVWFNPCRGETPYDGDLYNPLATTYNTYFHWNGAQSLDPGCYSIGVRAEHDTCDSEWTFSNGFIIGDSTWYNNTFQLIVNVSLEDGGNPEGANVKVDGANCYYESLLYENQADSEGLTFFDEVMHGTYDVKVSLPGYHTAVAEDFYLWQDDTVNVELKIYYVDIEENPESNSIKIFPNPATNQLNIQTEETIEEIKLINHIGQIVLVHQINNKQFTINTSGLEEGIYIVMIKTDKGVLSKRIVITN